MQANVGNFFARIFLGSLFNLALNLVFFGAGVYLAAKILNMQNNSVAKALSVAIIVFIASFVPRIFFFVDELFSLLIMLVVVLAAIKTAYRTDWLTSLLNLVIATAIAALASIAVSPVAAYTIWG